MARGRGCIHFAAIGGRLEICKALVDMEISVDTRDDEGFSALHLAVLFDRRNVVLWLLQRGATADLATVAGDSPLRIAARYNFSMLATYLLGGGATVDWVAVDVPVALPQSPLAEAACEGSTETLLVLLAAGASVNRLDGAGMTPLLRAVEGGSWACISALLTAGAEVTHRGEWGRTVLHVAADRGDLEAVTRLRANDAWEELVPIRDNLGKRAVDLAAAQGHRAIQSLLESSNGGDSV